MQLEYQRALFSFATSLHSRVSLREQTDDGFFPQDLSVPVRIGSTGLEISRECFLQSQLNALWRGHHKRLGDFQRGGSVTTLGAVHFQRGKYIFHLP